MVQRLKLFFVLFLFIILMNFSFTSALFGNNEIIRTRSININNFTFNGTGTETDPYWKANWSNFTLLYQNQLGNTSSGISWATANNGTLLNYSNALNGSVETKWNANATNFTVVYQYVLNGTFSTGISYATAQNGSLLNYTNALNNTLMQQANWNATNVSYLTVANWNSTNTSYYLVSNPSLFYNITQNDINFNLTSYFNITNQTVSHFYINASNGRIGFGTTTPQNTLNVIGIINATKEIFSYGLNLTTGYGYALNASGISWATANNGTLLNYSNALNGTLVNQSYLTTWNFYNVTNFPQNASLMTYANWNATNSTYRTGDNNTFVANNITVTNLYVVNGTGGAYIRHNGTGWLIVG